MNKQIKEGMKGYFTCRGRYVNPYPRSNKKYNLYERGWTQALKRSRSWEQNKC